MMINPCTSSCVNNFILIFWTSQQLKCRGTKPSKAISERPLNVRQHFSHAHSSHIAQQPIFAFLRPIVFFWKTTSRIQDTSSKQRTFLEIETHPRFLGLVIPRVGVYVFTVYFRTTEFQNNVLNLTENGLGN